MSRSRISASLTLLFVLFTSTAASGQIFCDNFGQNGLAFSLQSNNNQFRVVRQLANGSILAGGRYNTSVDTDGLLAKLSADGAPFSGFGESGGLAIPNLNTSGSDEIQSIVPLANGRILLGGQQENSCFISLLNSDGSFNTSFGTNGKTTLGTAQFYEELKDVVVNGSTAYTVSVFTSGPIVGAVLLRAFSVVTGQPILTFGTNGLVSTGFATAIVTRPAKVLTQPDGKLLVMYSAPDTTATYEIITVTRRLPNGGLDSTFGVNGVLEEPEFAPLVAASMALDADGNIYVGAFVNSPSMVVCKKWKSNGSSDNSFGLSGSSIHLPAGADARIYDIQLDANRNVYFIGSRLENGIRSLLIGRWDADGEDLNTFGANFWAYPGATSTLGYSLQFTGDGKFLVAGQVEFDGGKVRGFVARFGADGSLDGDFAAQGTFLGQVVRNSIAEDLRILNNGKILVAGVQGTELGAKYALAQFLPDGSPDPGFGEDGYVVGAFESRIKTIHILSDGRIVAGGYANTPDPADLPGVTGTSQVVFRLHPDGSLDSTFGNNGKVSRHWGNPATDNTFSNMRVDLNGNILLAGGSRFSASSYTDIAVTRMLPDGALDPAFGNNGLVVVSPAVISDFNKDIAVDALGRVLVSGNSNANPHVKGFLFRLLTDGTIDSSFATNGTFTYARPEGDNRLEQLLVLQDGNIAVINTAEHGPQIYVDTICVLRLLPNGTLDPSYGDGGRAKVLIPNSKSVRNKGFKEDAQGNLYFSGDIIVSGLNTSYVASLAPNGQMNTAFGNSGYVLTNVFVPKGDLAVANNGSVYLSFTIGFIGGLNAACVGASAAMSLNEEQMKSAALRIYPNPAFGQVILNWDGSQKPAVVRLFDLNGRSVYPPSTEHLPDGSLQLAVSGLPGGIYLVRVSQNGQEFVGKLVVGE